MALPLTLAGSSSPIENHWEELSIEESQCVIVKDGLRHDPVLNRQGVPRPLS